MSRLTTAAVVIPLLGLVTLIGRAEIRVRSGDSWQISITGYDPRDLLHGRFLRYRYQLNWQGADTCGPTATGGVPTSNRGLDEDCCLCLARGDHDGVDPPVNQVGCDEVEPCNGWLHSASLQGPQRYFVPEDRALDLETALRDRKASLELKCGPDGKPAIKDLLLDGSSWRD